MWTRGTCQPLRCGWLRRLSTAAAHYDVVIAGGGLVGCAMAAALQSSKALPSRRVLLLEHAPRRSYVRPEEYANRVVALNHSTRELFQRVGVWAGLEAQRVRTVRGMHVWDASRSDGTNLLSFFPGNAERAHFYIVENDLVVHELGQRLEAAERVEVGYESGLQACRPTERGMEIELNDGRQITTTLLVGAEGARSVVRESMADNPYLAKSYDQFGVVGVLHMSQPSANDVAWQKFLPTGPVALLPLSDTRSSLVWTLPTARAQALIRGDPAELVAQLNAALRPHPPTHPDVVPQIERVTQVDGFPLGLGHASRYCQPGRVLIGDSAHRVHPLAGQGVNLGFGDVASLVRNLEAGVLRGERFADYPALLAYETERQRQNVPMMLGIDFFQQIYGTSHPVITAARNFGVGLVNANPRLKHLIASMAA
eukprot:snap_masked-scaffold11_size778918-processed-gene-6.14 protein:Tk03681 transcript:snap_masked-scaffold11_size778918-processed-gene-6.14-mRNA-1 annotation:"ubiquinone biosynthesis monooxygenase coq6-like"